MRTIEIRKYETLVRVRDFGKSYGHLFPKSTLAGQEFAAVGAAVKELGGYAVDKRSTARDGVLSRELARQALAEYVDMVRRTALAMAADIPDLEIKFRISPRTDTELLNAGHQFLRDAEPLQHQFVLHGMPRTFLADLEAVVSAFEAAVSQWNAAKGKHAAARKDIETTIAAGFAALQKLDVIVPNQLRDDPGTLANWEHERRVEWKAKSRRSRKPASTTSSTPTSTTTPPATSPTTPPVVEPLDPPPAPAPVVVLTPPAPVVAPGFTEPEEPATAKVA